MKIVPCKVGDVNCKVGDGTGVMVNDGRKLAVEQEFQAMGFAQKT